MRKPSRSGNEEIPLKYARNFNLRIAQYPLRRVSAPFPTSDKGVDSGDCEINHDGPRGVLSCPVSYTTCGVLSQFASKAPPQAEVTHDSDIATHSHIPNILR